MAVKELESTPTGYLDEIVDELVDEKIETLDELINEKVVAVIDEKFGENDNDSAGDDVKKNQ